MDCVFCNIIKGDIPSYTVYEDNIVKVFLDIHPHANGHMLIIPKKHMVDIFDVESDVLTYIYKEIVPKMYRLLQERLGADGLHVGQNNGIAEEVKHYHVHLIPTYQREYKVTDVESIYNKLK